MTYNYDPFDWFWIVGGDESRAWSSKTMAYVTEWPADQTTQIASESELWTVLREAGVLKTKVYKANIWLSCTDAEYDAINVAMASAPPRLQAVFNAALYLDTTSQLFPLVLQIATQAVGADRAALLLTPTE